MRGAGEERGEDPVASHDSALVIVYFFQLGALGVERYAVTFEIDVDALRAVRSALVRRLAAVAERTAALDAGTRQSGPPPLEEKDWRGQDGQDRGEGNRILRTDERIEPGVVAEQTPGHTSAGERRGDGPGRGNGWTVDADLQARHVRGGELLDSGPVETPGLVELRGLVLELV